MNKNSLLGNIAGLIKEGRQVLDTKYQAGGQFNRRWWVEPQVFARWRAGYVNLLRMLGPLGDPWKDVLASNASLVSVVQQMLGTLEAIEEAVNNDLLVSVEDLISAEIFDDLLDQADYLLSEKYFLAAGVLGRAVLEEHLRKWSALKSCLPEKARPTINDYKDSLYKAKVINKIEMKTIELLAAVGNDAAHNKETLEGADVERMLRDVRDLLTRYPLSSL